MRCLPPFRAPPAPQPPAILRGEFLQQPLLLLPLELARSQFGPELLDLGAAVLTLRGQRPLAPLAFGPLGLLRPRDGVLRGEQLALDPGRLVHLFYEFAAGRFARDQFRLEALGLHPARLALRRDGPLAALPFRSLTLFRLCDAPLRGEQPPLEFGRLVYLLRQLAAGRLAGGQLRLEALGLHAARFALRREIGFQAGRFLETASRSWRSPSAPWPGPPADPRAAAATPRPPRNRVPVRGFSPARPPDPPGAARPRA